MENLKIDENNRNVLGGVTNDVSELIKNLRVNPANGRLLVDANITSTNTSIGSTIPGGTAGSILFLGAGSTLAQDNANLFYDDTNNFVGFGTNVPTATLDIQGTFRIDDGSAVTGYVWTATDGNGNGTWELPGAGASGYNLIQNSGVSVTQRTTINLSNLLTASDVGAKTALTINVLNLANDSTFITDLLANTTFTTGLGNNVNFITALTTNATFLSDLANSATFITDLTNNATFQSDVITFINSSGSVAINLATQVTGILLIAHGGTNSGTALSGSTIMISNGSAIVQGTAGTTTTVLHGNAAGAPTYSAVNLTTDVTGVLPVANGGTGTTSNALILVDGADTTPGYLDPKINIHSNDGSVTITKSITNPAGNEILDYDLSATQSVAILPLTLPYLTSSTNNPWNYNTQIDVTEAHGTWIDLSGLAASGSFDNVHGILPSATFNNNKSFKVQYVLKYTGTPTTISFHGISGAGETVGGSGGGNPFAAFAWNAGISTDFYAVTQDNAGAQTSVLITPIVLTNANVFRIELDPANGTPQVRFYLNGTLITTITTNLPFAGTNVIGFSLLSASIDPKLDYITQPTFEIEL